MTAPWDAGPCLWPDGEQLERDLAEVDEQLEQAAAEYWSRAGICRVPAQNIPDPEPTIETVTVIGGVL
ncbi:hypothetical protein [Streptomyces sp. NPDC059165]|uniref:hypothetical protein n=1 Tax=Streptomyces sp. NPDC059165 TaxID=3346751 RepID=UPI003697FD78